MHKKLQIFVSSTYSDLTKERQAAVEAILKAHHIPAGMELFAAGDKSQLEVIKKWIDESDLFLLILGGRYGTIEKTTEKSYIQLEYEYAEKSKTPVFSVVLSDKYIDKKVEQQGKEVLELEHSERYRRFKDKVKSKMCCICDNEAELKAGIQSSILDYINNSAYNFNGWISGKDASVVAISDKLTETFGLAGLYSAFRIKKQNNLREVRIKEIVAQEVSHCDHKGFRLSASSGNNYLNVNGKVWGDAKLGEIVMKGSAQLHVVLESPFSAFSITRAIANNVDYHHWEDKMSFHRLKELNNYDNITIKITDHAVNCSLFFTSDSVFYDPYIWAKPESADRTENNFWVFEFIRRDNPDYNFECYHLLEKHFNFLYNTAVPLEEFLGSNDVNYHKGSEEFHKKVCNERSG